MSTEGPYSICPLFSGNGYWIDLRLLWDLYKPINLGSGCTHEMISTHEMLHALAMLHEQSRPDRDQYIVVHWDAITSSSGFLN